MNDLRFALRQLRKSPGFTSIVVITLALGIGANAAIFTIVRGVLIKPLVNRDEDRLIYIGQSAPGIGNKNSTWSMPEIQDLKARVKSLSEFGGFSTVPFTMFGLGEPREVNGGVVNGSYFEVMGLRPVLGRLIGPEDDGPKAARVVVLTYPMPGVFPVAASALVLLTVAMVASMLPAARAASVDVIQALRTE
jgi:hypothetical protein